jgi:hypothetical protein
MVARSDFAPHIKSPLIAMLGATPLLTKLAAIALFGKPVVDLVKRYAIHFWQRWQCSKAGWAIETASEWPSEYALLIYVAVFVLRFETILRTCGDKAILMVLVILTWVANLAVLGWLEKSIQRVRRRVDSLHRDYFTPGELSALELESSPHGNCSQLSIFAFAHFRLNRRNGRVVLNGLARFFLGGQPGSAMTQASP